MTNVFSHLVLAAIIERAHPAGGFWHTWLGPWPHSQYRSVLIAIPVHRLTLIALIWVMVLHLPHACILSYGVMHWLTSSILTHTRMLRPHFFSTLYACCLQNMLKRKWTKMWCNSGAIVCRFCEWAAHQRFTQHLIWHLVAEHALHRTIVCQLLKGWFSLTWRFKGEVKLKMFFTIISSMQAH